MSALYVYDLFICAFFLWNPIFQTTSGIFWHFRGVEKLRLCVPITLRQPFQKPIFLLGPFMFVKLTSLRLTYEGTIADLDFLVTRVLHRLNYTIFPLHFE